MQNVPLSPLTQPQANGNDPCMLAASARVTAASTCIAIDQNIHNCRTSSPSLLPFSYSLLVYNGKPKGIKWKRVMDGIRLDGGVVEADRGCESRGEEMGRCVGEGQRKEGGNVVALGSSV